MEISRNQHEVTEHRVGKGCAQLILGHRELALVHYCSFRPFSSTFYYVILLMFLGLLSIPSALFKPES